TLLSGNDNSHTQLGQDRPNIIGNAYGSGACTGATIACRDWLNPASFVQNPAGTFGNVGKGSLRYPGYYNWDMGLGKSFKFTERVGLQFRAEFFNVFNRVNFSEDAVSGTGNFLKKSSTGNFGALKSAQDPRIGQLGLKLSF
ncbi:MAG TPA: carboxypeptidase regulatory-like domain-containing protein, partial [Terriglobales bacterium]